MLVVGLISGTSADGVDAALVDICEVAGGRLDFGVRHWLTVPYPEQLRRAVLDACGEPGATTAQISRLNFVIGEEFARAARTVAEAAGVRVADLDLIGSHGQTIWHDPFPTSTGLWQRSSTLQLGEPQLIAERTGVTVVADFRPRDMAAGGQGAPLVPLVDFLTLGDAVVGRIALNLGGIANITVLPAGCRGADVFGFDTGPGNMILDAVVQAISGGALSYDRGGLLAAAGRVDSGWLEELGKHPYFRVPPPKSTGREVFGHHYARQCLAAGRERGLGNEDVVATLTAHTAETVVGAIEQHVLPRATFTEVIVSGGGALNAYLCEQLKNRLARIPAVLRTSDDLGLPIEGKEAVAFAVLAYLTLHGRPGNLPGVTGALRPVVLGVIAPGDNFMALHTHTRIAPKPPVTGP
jgi:anhydro-N-acetylmuramic acid kinase